MTETRAVSAEDNVDQFLKENYNNRKSLFSATDVQLVLEKNHHVLIHRHVLN